MVWSFTDAPRAPIIPGQANPSASPIYQLSISGTPTSVRQGDTLLHVYITEVLYNTLSLSNPYLQASDLTCLEPISIVRIHVMVHIQSVAIQSTYPILP